MRRVCQGWGWRTGAEAEAGSAPVLESLSLHRTSPMVPRSPWGSPELHLACCFAGLRQCLLFQVQLPLLGARQVSAGGNG